MNLEQLMKKTYVKKWRYNDENTVAKLKSSLPFDQSQKDILNKETEKAYYEVEIYIQNLMRKKKELKTTIGL